jgi:ketol-acid reductoisomerase
VDRHTKREMKKILEEIQSGKFARQWISENRRGRKKYRQLLEKDLAHPIEKVGRKLRARMPWLQEGTG